MVPIQTRLAWLALPILWGEVALPRDVGRWEVLENSDRRSVAAVVEAHMSIDAPQKLIISFGCAYSGWVALYQSSLHILPHVKVSFSAFNVVDSLDATGKKRSEPVTFSADAIPDADGDIAFTETEAIRFADFIASVSATGAAVILKSAASDDSILGFIPGDSRESIETVFRDCSRKYGMARTRTR